jgi:hypothetical protein
MYENRQATPRDIACKTRGQGAYPGALRMADRHGIAFATESVSHIKLNRYVNPFGQAPSLQIWKVRRAGVMTESANGNANEAFCVKPG